MRFDLSVLFAAILLFVFPVAAEEQITSFDVTINVETSGDILVTEEITVIAEGNSIRRGIFRDLPRYYTDESQTRLPFEYEVLSVTRGGQPEAYITSTDGNALRIRIGNASVFLENGSHTYEIRYSVKNQVRYFDTYDEVYWNATGSYWDFPIRSATATVNLPPGGFVTAEAGYTGRAGQAGADYRYQSRGDTHVFETTRSLSRREGLTVALGFRKGLIDPPSASDITTRWWQRNGALAVLVASLVGLFWFYWSGFNRVGRDPAKPPVIPRYAPPRGYSPAAVHHIWHRALSSHNALIATLVHAGIKNYLILDNESPSKTKVSVQKSVQDAMDITAEDRQLIEQMFNSKKSMTLGSKYDADFTYAYGEFKKELSSNYGTDYFRWNPLYWIVAIIVSFVAVVFAVTQFTNWTMWHTIAVLALAVMNIWFMYLIPAPTEKGQEIRTEIEGFKLYLETAEKLQLNSAEVGDEAPPAMTTERYEKFLPYAIALGVEKPWTEHFERQIPKEAENYSPHWTNYYRGSNRSMTAMNTALIGALSSGVVSAMPQSSSSSGSGGGGFSGGGGGGGGGGGW